MATADLTVIGLGRPDPSAGAYIAAIQVLKLDERRDRPEQTLDDKVASVERHLGEDG
jgi:uncharacterized protein YqgV (UPF0045/DUF77 family)